MFDHMTMASSKLDKFDPDMIVISSASDSEITDVEIGKTLFLPVSPSKKVFTPTRECSDSVCERRVCK